MNNQNKLFQPIGGKIRRARRHQNMTQQELADELGISRQALGNIERAEEVDENKLEQIALALGVTTEDIKNFPEEMSTFQIEHMHDHAQAIYLYNTEATDKITELYERLLEAEKDKNKLLQQLLLERDAK